MLERNVDSLTKQLNAKANREKHALNLREIINDVSGIHDSKF